MATVFSGGQIGKHRPDICRQSLSNIFIHKDRQFGHEANMPRRVRKHQTLAQILVGAHMDGAQSRSAQTERNSVRLLMANACTARPREATLSNCSAILTGDQVTTRQVISVVLSSFRATLPSKSPPGFKPRCPSTMRSISFCCAYSAIVDASSPTR